MKELASSGGEILGCHIIGLDVSTPIQEIVVAMKPGTGSAFSIRESVHIRLHYRRQFNGPSLGRLCDKELMNTVTRTRSLR